MRGLAEGALALAVSLTLWFLSPLPHDDPFQQSLWIVPWVVWGRLLIERSLTGRPLDRGPLAVLRAPAASSRIELLESAALVALVLLAFGRRSLGLAVTDWFLAAGFFLLLAHTTARLVPKLRVRLGRRLPLRPSPVFFFLPLLIYLAILPWTLSHRQPDGDEPYYLLLTHSLAYDLDADLANNYAAKDGHLFLGRPLEPQPGDPTGPGGEVYSRHNILLPLFLAPFYRLAGYPGALLVMALLSAFLAWLFLRLAGRQMPDQPGAALLGYLLFAFAPPLLLYSYQVWIEVPAALLVALALDQIWAAEPTRRGRWILVATIVLLPLLKLRLGLVAASLVVLAWWRWRDARQIKWSLALALGVATGGLLLYNLWRYGNPLKIHQLAELGWLDDSPLTSLRHLSGMFFDPAFGLFASAPLWLLLLPGLFYLLRDRPSFLVDVVVVSGAYLLALAPRLEWYGGWSPPFRYPLLFLPLFALALIPVFARRHRPLLRPALAALLTLTAILTVIWLVVPGWTYNFADGRTHLLDRAGMRLGADVARLFPSAVRPRLATWVWPLAALALSLASLWRGRRPISVHWGVVAVLVLALAVPLAATRLPSRHLEFEDPWIAKRGGSSYPDRWVPARPSYRGSWLIRSRSRVVAPLIAGGDRLSVTLALRFIENEPGKDFILRLAAGETVLQEQRIEPLEGWQELTLGPFDWPQGEPLVILGPDEPAAPSWRHNAVLLDRAELAWE